MCFVWKKSRCIYTSHTEGRYEMLRKSKTTTHNNKTECKQISMHTKKTNADFCCLCLCRLSRFWRAIWWCHSFSSLFAHDSQLYLVSISQNKRHSRWCLTDFFLCCYSCYCVISFRLVVNAVAFLCLGFLWSSAVFPHLVSAVAVVLLIDFPRLNCIFFVG